MLLEVPSSSSVVEEAAAVYAARLAQLAARHAKKGAKTAFSAALADKSADPCHPEPLTEEGNQVESTATKASC